MGWVLNPCQKPTWVAWAKAVVIPQVGHGFPNRVAQPHAGRPNWVCVPSPRGSGRSPAATTSTERHASAITAAPMRSPTEARAIAGRAALVKLEHALAVPVQV